MNAKRKAFKNRYDRMLALMCKQAGLEFPTAEIADAAFLQVKSRFN